MSTVIINQVYRCCLPSIIQEVSVLDIGLFWQAVSESSFNPNAQPEKREQRLQAIVEKVVSKYPPEKK